MSTTHEVISAFLDDEPFKPEELAHALSDPAGRALLLDLIALHRMVQPTGPMPVMKAPAPGKLFGWRTAAAAAALVLAVAGGYLAGERRSVTASSEAPQPTRVVEAVPFVPTGGIR